MKEIKNFIVGSMEKSIPKYHYENSMEKFKNNKINKMLKIKSSLNSIMRNFKKDQRKNRAEIEITKILLKQISELIKKEYIVSYNQYWANAAKKLNMRIRPPFFQNLINNLEVNKLLR